MTSLKNRHNFLHTASAASIGSTQVDAASPLTVAGRKPSKVPLGVCNYALRGMKLSGEQVVDYAIEQKLDSVLINCFRSFRSLAEIALEEVRERANANDVSIYVGGDFSVIKTSSLYREGYETPEDGLKEAIRVASILGSPTLTIRIGMLPERYSPGGIEIHIQEVIRLLKLLRGVALDAGIKFAVENHQDLRTEEVVRIISETGRDVCGALLDPANAICVLDDPLRAMKMLGEDVLCTSVRDFTAFETADGAGMQCTAIGQGMMDFKHYRNFLAEKCPGVPMHVETIGSEVRPIPFLEAGFWDGFPDLRASGTVDFLKRIKQGKPFELEASPLGGDQAKLEIGRQREMLEQSLGFLREDCGVGLKSKN